MGPGDDQHLLWVEVGVPGVAADFLVGMGPWADLGGGLQVDFPPLNGIDQGLPGAAVHLIGNAHLKVARFEPVALFVHLDPQWIMDFSGVSLLYAPINLGVGLELDQVHLAVEMGVAPYTAELSPVVPFGNGGLAPPTVGVILEAPVNERVEATLRLRLQTFPWSSNLFSDSGAASLYFFGALTVGVAYRL
jgi:hypothetical protein